MVVYAKIISYIILYVSFAFLCLAHIGLLGHNGLLLLFLTEEPDTLLPQHLHLKYV